MPVSSSNFRNVAACSSVLGRSDDNMVFAKKKKGKDVIFTCSPALYLPSATSLEAALQINQQYL